MDSRVSNVRSRIAQEIGTSPQPRTFYQTRYSVAPTQTYTPVQVPVEEPFMETQVVHVPTSNTLPFTPTIRSRTPVLHADYYTSSYVPTYTPTKTVTRQRRAPLMGGTALVLPTEHEQNLVNENKALYERQLD